MKNNLEVGQQVSYWYTYRGGYGLTQKLSGIVEKLNPKKATLRCTQTNRQTGEKREILRSINYENIVESSTYIKPFTTNN